MCAVTTARLGSARGSHIVGDSRGIFASLQHNYGKRSVISGVQRKKKFEYSLAGCTMRCAAAPVPQHLWAAPLVFPPVQFLVHLRLSFLASSPFQRRCSFLCRIMQVIKRKEMNECAEDIKQCPKEFQSQSSAFAVFRLQKLQQAISFFIRFYNSRS